MPDKHSIAILCHASAGGSGVVATELALSLIELGHNVHIIATERPFRLTDDRLAISGQRPSVIQDLGSEPRGMAGLAELLRRGREGVWRWMGGMVGSAQKKGQLHFHQILSADYPLFSEPMTTLTAANSLAEVIQKYGIEIVHAHYAIPHATSALMARDMGLPVKVVTTLHGTDISLLGNDPAFAYTTRHAVLNSDAVTAVSQALADETRITLGIERDIQVVYNWVDAERFKPCSDPEQRKQFAQPEEAIIFHASNFRPVKRTEDAIRVFAGIAKSRPARMLMLGSGPERPKAIALAQELGVFGRIQFMEFTPAPEQLMSVADLLLLPSQTESFGLVALEAMACGAVVIASQVGGLPEVVVDGETGYLCPVGDTQAMTEAALQALADPERRKQMGEAARRRAIQHFHPERILPQYLSVYQSVLLEDAQLPLEKAWG